MMGKTAQWGKIVKKCLRKFMVKKTIVNRNYANWILFFISFCKYTRNMFSFSTCYNIFIYFFLLLFKGKS